MNVPKAALGLLQADDEIVAAYLFGSRATDVHRYDSDWDFAVLWSEDVASPDRFRRRTRLIEALSHLLARRVDVLDLRSARVLIAAQALAGELLFDRNPAWRATFEMRIRGREDDERIALRTVLRAGRES